MTGRSNARDVFGIAAPLVCLAAIAGCSGPQPAYDAYDGSEYVPAESSGDQSEQQAPATGPSADPNRGGGGTAPAAATPPPNTDLPVIVNGKRLGAGVLSALAGRLGQHPAAGQYWYDPQSGLWGLRGHGAGGVTESDLLVTDLPRDASSGDSGVLVNGRELTGTELRAVVALLGWQDGDLAPYMGSYTLDDEGRFYRATGQFLGNLVHKSEALTDRPVRADVPAGCVLLHMGAPHAALGGAVTVDCD